MHTYVGPSSILRSVCWWWFTEVSGQPIDPIFTGRTVITLFDPLIKFKIPGQLTFEKLICITEICTYNPDVQKFSKNLGTTSKF